MNRKINWEDVVLTTLVAYFVLDLTGLSDGLEWYFKLCGLVIIFFSFGALAIWGGLK